MSEELDFESWINLGIDKGWVSNPFCTTHDGDPYMTQEEEQEWEELWQIMKGQKHSEFRKLKDVAWEDWFDGTGMNTWWD